MWLPQMPETIEKSTRGGRRARPLKDACAAVTVRRATVADASIVASHRREMFREMKSADGAVLDAMEQDFVPWVRQRIASEDYLGWLAVVNEGADEGLVVAGAGLWLMEWPPHIVGRGTRRGYLLNVYTREGHRRMGLARRLVEIAMEWCRVHGIEVMVLHASAAGRPIYEAMGFEGTNEMRLVL